MVTEHSNAQSVEDVVTSAVQEHLDRIEESGPGHLVTDWVLVAKFLDPQGVRDSFFWTSDEDLPWSDVLGLLRIGLLDVEDQYHRARDEEAED